MGSSDENTKLRDEVADALAIAKLAWGDIFAIAGGPRNGEYDLLPTSEAIATLAAAILNSEKRE